MGVEGASTAVNLFNKLTNISCSQDLINEGLVDRTLPIVKQFFKEPAPQGLSMHWMGPHSRNRDFYGRDEILRQLEQELTLDQRETSSSPGVRSFALCGLGGIGKTQTAVEYAYSRRHLYDVVFWMQADGVSKLNQSFALLAEKLCLLDAKNLSDPGATRKAALDWLSESGRRGISCSQEAQPLRWLLILDNIDDPDTLLEFWPPAGSGAILMTSRDPYAKSRRYSNHASKKGIDLDSLSSIDGSGLLRRLNENDTYAERNIASYEALSQRLGGLPLAIIQVSAYIQRRQMSCSEMIRMLDQVPNAKKILKSEAGLGSGEYNHSLCTVWALDDLDDASKSLLELLSFLDPDTISEALLTQVGPKCCSDGWFPDLDGYIDARSTLLQASLIRRNIANGQLMIHRMVQDVVRLHMDDTHSRLVFGKLVRLLSYGWPDPGAHKWSHIKMIWDAAHPIVTHIARMMKLYHGYNWDLDVSEQREVAGVAIKAGWLDLIDTY